MLKLLMDTSNQYLLVALYKDAQCLDMVLTQGSKRQSEDAIPTLEKMLRKQELELLDIDEMIITRGPGSYTGVRVAMTIAKTLSVLGQTRFKVLSSLQAYAGLDRCISVIDARSHKVFVCVYSQGEALMDEQIIDIDDFKTLRESYPDFKVVGQSDVVGYLSQSVDLAKNMYDLSLEADYVENMDTLVPVYLKNVEAKKICQ